MTVRDAIGITLVIAGILLLALGQPLLGLRGQVLCAIMVAIGVLLMYQSKRQRQIEEALDEYPARRDGHDLSGSHSLDLPDDD
jgi:hypothetical protein